MHIHTALLDQASDRFMDAAIEPTLWNRVLDDVAQASDACGGTIVPVFGNIIGHGVYSDSLGPVMDNYFRNEWNKRDFRAPHLSKLQSSGVLLEQDYATEADFARLDFYRELAEFGLRWTAIMGVRSGANLVIMVMNRKIADGPFERSEAEVFRGVQQKLTAAASIMTATADVEARGQASGLEAAGIGCVFLDRNGRVSLVNGRAEKLLGNELQISAGRLRGKRNADTVKLDMRLATLLGDGVSFSTLGGDAIAIARAGRRPLIVRMQRVSGLFREMFGSASVIALLEDPDDRIPARPSTLANVFELTAREAEIAVMLSGGMGLAMVSIQLNISYETVRSHVRAIFRKTGTNSQSQLAGLVGSIRL